MDLREAALGSSRRHPWEQARLAAVLDLLGRSPLPAHPSVLDIGCGDGWLLGELAARMGASRAVGVDTGLAPPPAGTEAGLTLQERPAPASPRNAPPASADPSAPSPPAGTPPGTPPAAVRLLHNLEALPAGERFDRVLLLDVLEHVADDRALLAQARDRIAPGGVLLATVPAHPILFSAHDAFLAHHRRYRPSELVSLARRAGLQVVARGGLFASLLLPRALSVLAQRALGARAEPVGVGAWRRGPLLTHLITGVLTWENRALLAAARQGLPLPGLSAWVLCTCPASSCPT